MKGVCHSSTEAQCGKDPEIRSYSFIEKDLKKYWLWHFPNKNLFISSLQWIRDISAIYSSDCEAYFFFCSSAIVRLTHTFFRKGKSLM